MLCNSKSNFPIFDCDVHVPSGLFVLCGGGGSAKSGVSNMVKTARLVSHATVRGGVELDVSCAGCDTGLKALCTSVAFRPHVDVKPVIIVGACANELWVMKADSVTDTELTVVCKHMVDPVATVDVVRFALPDLIVCGLNSGELITLMLAPDFGSLLVDKRLPGHGKGPITDLHVNTNKGWLLSTGGDDCLRIWDVTHGFVVLAVLPADVTTGLTFRKARFDTSGGKIFSLQVPKKGKGDSYMVVWEQSKGEQWVVSPTMSRSISPHLTTTLAVSPGGRFVAVSTADGAITLFAQETMRQVKVVRKIHSLPITGLFFPMPQSREMPPYLVSTSVDATVAMIPLDDDDDGMGLFDYLTYCLCLLLLVMSAMIIAFFVLWLHIVPTSPEHAMELIETHGIEFLQAIVNTTRNEGQSMIKKMIG